MIPWRYMYAICLLPPVFAALGIASGIVTGPPTRSLGLGLSAGCLAYAVARVMAFHPACNANYHAWLMTTNWSPRKPLPFGSPLPRVEDLVLLLPTAAGVLLGIGPLPFAIAAATYAATLCPLIVERNARAAKVFFVLAGVAVVCSVDPWLFAVSTVPLVAVAIIANRKVMAFLPRARPQSSQARAAELSKQKVGYPFNRTAPTVSNPGQVAGFGSGMEHKKAIPIAVIIAWVVFCLAFRLECSMGLGWQTGRFISAAFQMMGSCVVVVVAALRLFQYVTVHGPEISVLSRIKSGRLILPKYDSVYVAPALILVVGILINYLPVAAGMNSVIMNNNYSPLSSPDNFVPAFPSACLALTISVVWYLAATVGPTYEKWHLTGGHRLDRLKSYGS